jgi:hypothetical protein
MAMCYAHYNRESLRPAIEVMDGWNREFITILSQCPKKRGHKTVFTTCNPLIFMVGQGRIELPTLGFSVRCSTD